MPRANTISLCFHLLLFLLSHLTTAQPQCGLPWDLPNGPPQLAPGWKAHQLLTNLTKPRTIAFDTHENLLILEATAGITILTLTSTTNHCPVITSRKTLVSLPALNHGLALHPNGTKLFASSSDNVYAWDYNPVTQVVSNQRIVIAGMGNLGIGGHATRTLYIPKSSPNTLLISRGTGGSLDTTCLIKSSYCTIKSFDISTIPQQPLNFTTKGTILAWGLRNSVGITENQSDGGSIWSVEGSADNLLRNGIDIHENNPAEELNYHGKLTNPATNPLIGTNYGYPNCFTTWDPSSIPFQNTPLTRGSPFTPSPNATFTDLTCATTSLYQPARLPLQAHSSPLGLTFYTPSPPTCSLSPPTGGLNCTEFAGHLFISFHGSVNRAVPVGYEVGYVEFGKDKMPVGGLAGVVKRVMWNGGGTVCPNGCFRPVGLGFDRLGRLFVVSDSTGDLIILRRG